MRHSSSTILLNMRHLIIGYCITKNFGRIKTWRIDRSIVLVRENVGEFTIATLVNLEFGWVKYWRMVLCSPNPPKFSPAKMLHYTVACIKNFKAIGLAGRLI